MNEAQLLGSKTAKDGFKNEQDVVNRFNEWENDIIAQEWLKTMGYKISDIEYVKATCLKGLGYKTDVQVQISILIKLKSAIDVQNLQVKLVSNLKGFNQIDKRWTDKYAELWNMPENIVDIFKYFTGEYEPFLKKVKDSRRMFITELPIDMQTEILSWLNENKTLIVSDILKGRGKFAAEWMLVVQKVDKNSRWTLVPINKCMNFFGNGDIEITPRGSIKIGRITIQRKGGDAGRETAKMLQFKINPAELFELV